MCQTGNASIWGIDHQYVPRVEISVSEDYAIDGPKHRWYPAFVATRDGGEVSKSSLNVASSCAGNSVYRSDILLSLHRNPCAVLGLDGRGIVLSWG